MIDRFRDVLRDRPDAAGDRKIVEECPIVENSLTIDQTSTIFNEWAKEQKIEAVDELKQVMKGFPVQVNIKNKEPTVLPHTPVLLQCNTTPWAKSFGQEHMTFMNRIHGFHNLKPSMVLSFIDDKTPDPRFFQEVFATMMSLDDKNGEWSYSEVHNFWDMYKTILSKKVDELVTHFKKDVTFVPMGTYTQNTKINSIMSDIMNEKKL